MDKCFIHCVYFKFLRTIFTTTYLHCRVLDQGMKVLWERTRAKPISHFSAQAPPAPPDGQCFLGSLYYWGPRNHQGKQWGCASPQLFGIKSFNKGPCRSHLSMTSSSIKTVQRDTESILHPPEDISVPLPLQTDCCLPPTKNSSLIPASTQDFHKTRNLRGMLNAGMESRAGWMALVA